MAKKLPLLSLPILTLTISTLAATVPNPASAAIFAPNGDKVWTLEEVIPAAAELEDVFARECPDDISCQIEIYEEYKASSGLYKGVQTFYNAPFMLTSINPSTGDIKIFFHTRKTTFGSFTPREDTITETQMVWADEGSPDIINFYGGMIPVDLPDWAHHIYSAKRSTEGPDWIPSGTEFEISAPESNLELNTSGLIKYTSTGVYSYTRGTINYSSCLNSPYYEPGVECRLVFKDANSVYEYVPYKDGRPAYPDSGYVEPSTPVTPTTDPEDGEPNDETGTTSEGNYVVESTAPTVTEPVQLPKVPETGTQTYPAEVCSREISLPWWIIALILAGNALLIWWFVPNRQKSRKNTKKS